MLLLVVELLVLGLETLPLPLTELPGPALVVLELLGLVLLVLGLVLVSLLLVEPVPPIVPELVGPVAGLVAVGLVPVVVAFGEPGAVAVVEVLLPCEDVDDWE